MLKQKFSYSYFIKRQLIILLCLYAFIFKTNAQQTGSLKFEVLNSSDGLSHNKVQCILQDKQGYIWFGTVYGLNRYDGYNFKVFENIPGDSSSLANNDIISLYQDSDDIIWIGTSTVLAAYNPGTGKFLNYSFPILQGWIHSFYEDNNHRLWIASANGLFSLDKTRKKIMRHATDNNGRENIQGVIPDKEDKNILWLSAENGFRKLNILSGKTISYQLPYLAFADIYPEITHNIIQDKNGHLWMAATNHGVYKLNPATGEIIHKEILQPITQNASFTCIMEDSDSCLWVGSEGVLKYRFGNDDWQHITGANENIAVTSTRIRAFLKDRNGIYWVATERGIAKYDTKLSSFTTVKAHYPFALENANTIIEDSYKNFWVGNYVGLGTVDMNTGIYTNQNKLLSKNAAIYSAIKAADGSMWFGAQNGLIHLYRHVGQQWQTEHFPIMDEKNVEVRSLAFRSNNDLWIGTNSTGLYLFNTIKKTFEPYNSFQTTASNITSLNITSVCSISPDSLLLGTIGKGIILVQVKNKHYQKIDFVKKEEITAIDNAIINTIYIDKQKNIWIGTNGGGLWKTDTRLSYFFNYSVKNGLQSTSINQITEDDKGQLWLNTIIGLEIIDPQHNRFVHYSAKDGLSIGQKDYLVKKSNGDIARIDFNGLHTFHSSSINLNKEVPPVYINQMQVMDKTIPIYKDTIIHLKYNENYISFAYVALNYTQSFKNRYTYMLEGLEKKWTDAGDRRFATYANVGPGTYTFHVKAANNNGIWNENGAIVTFIISQPWWNTWWFYTLVVIVVASIVYIIFQFKLQQKIKAVEVRNTISRDLHDEVGSTLSSIGFLSSMALNDAEDSNSRITSTLNTINESSTRMLDAMNDIIWNIQPKNDTVQNIIARMIAFASDILESRKIDLHLHTGEHLDRLHLGLTERHNFYMIYKEAINNLAKYSHATEAWISLEYKEGYLLLEIKDNGKGFNPANAREGGNGLRNMKSRAEKINAYYRMETVINKGTTIVLQLKPSKS